MERRLPKDGAQAAGNSGGVPVPPKKVDPLYGWVLVAVGTAIIAIINGSFYSYGVFFKPLLQDFGWTRAELSGPVSLRLAATGIFGIIAGVIADRAGPRLVVPAGVLLVAVGYALTSRVTGIWEMYLYMGLIIGVGMSVPYPALTALISRWFTAKRGLAMGIVLAGFGLGQIIFPPLVTRWIASYSWQTAFIYLALIAVFVGVPLGFLLKVPNNEETTPIAKDPPSGRTKVLNQEAASWSLRDGLRSLALWQISLVYLLFSACLQALMVHLVPHAIDVGIKPLAASVLIGVIGAANVAGRIAGGGFSDKLGTKRILIWSLITSGLALLALCFTKSFWGLYFIAGVYGLGYGGISITVPKLASEYFALSSLGVIIGIIQLAFAAGGAVGAPLAGFIFDRTNSYVLAFAVLFIFLVVALVLCLSLRPPRRPAASWIPD